MKEKNLIKKMLALLLVAVLCLTVVGCGNNDKTKDEKQNSSISEDVDSSSEQPDETPTQSSSQTVVTPTQEMCWSCGDLPVTGTNIYCANCKCMLCNQRRKIGNYMYCSNHNCNDSGCAAMAVENSQYCVSHKCAMPNCRNKIWSGSQYCATHK